ncbi:MAG: tandem-95 repeat protein, partial [Pseudomonadota bacterium]
MTQEADANGEIEFHDLGSGFVLRLPEGTTEDFILRVKAIATESDPVIDDEDREAVNGVVINVGLLESPEANDDTAVTAEDTPVTIDVLDNDVDSDGDPLTVIDVLGVSNGSADINDDGTITFTPDPDFSGEAEFTYTITDGNGGVSDATVKVLVGGVADTPNLLLPNALETFDLSPILLDRIDASLMDTDGSESLKVKFRGLPQGTKIENPGAIAANTTQIDDLRAENETLARERTEAEEELVLLNGRLQDAEADPNFPPTELEELRNRKAGVEDLIKGLVARTAENEATVAELFKQNEQLSQMADENGEIEFHGFGDGFLMQLPEGTVDDLQIKVDATSTESEPLAGPEFETATISRSFQIMVRESLAPQDDFATTIEDVPVTVFATANDVGEGPQVIEVGAAANGGVVIDDNGDLVYTPNANFSGIDTFVYRVADIFGVSEIATVQVTVGGVADMPNLTLPDGLLTTDLAPISLDGIQASLVDTDDSESLTVKFGGLPEGSNISNPSRFAAFNGRLEVVEADIARNEALTAETERNLAETIAAIDELSNITDPTEDQLNELARLEQGREALLGELQTLSDQRAEFVARRDELRPIVDDLSQSADKDGHIEIKGFGPGFILQLPEGVIDDFKLTVEAIATESAPLASPDTETASASGEVQVSVRESPQAVDDAITVREDVPEEFNVVANDVDSDGDALTVVDVTDGANGTTEDLGGGNIRYTPNLNFSGDDQFTYTIRDPDGNSSTATVRVVVNGVADLPGLTVPESLQTIDLADISLDNIRGSLADDDGSENLLIRLSDVPDGAVVTNPGAIADREAERGRLDTSIKSLRIEVGSKQQQVDDKLVELADLKGNNAPQVEIDDLNQQISDHNDEIGLANARIDELELEIAAFTISPPPGFGGIAGYDGSIGGWVLRLPPGTTEDFVLGVEALTFESDPVLNNDDRQAASDRIIVGVKVLESSRAKDDSVQTDEDTPIDINVLA